MNCRLTQKELAKKLVVSEAAISRWENDVCYPDIMLLPVIAQILGTNIDTLFCYQPQKESRSQQPIKSRITSLYSLAKT